jgi:hypothetical protein
MVYYNAVDVRKCGKVELIPLESKRDVWEKDAVCAATTIDLHLFSKVLENFVDGVHFRGNLKAGTN